MVRVVWRGAGPNAQHVLPASSSEQLHEDSPASQQANRLRFFTRPTSGRDNQNDTCICCVDLTKHPALGKRGILCVYCE